jgi:hypothetical protein
VFNTSSGSGSAGASVREVTFESLSLGEQISGGGFCVMHRGDWMNLHVASTRTILCPLALLLPLLSQ